MSEPLPNAAPPSDAPRSWLQFSLRGLLALTAIIAAFFGWREWRCWPARQQASRIAAVRALQGEVTAWHPGENPFRDFHPPSWEESWLGIPDSLEVWHIGIYDLNDELWKHAAALQPRSLHLGFQEVTPAVIARVQEFPQLTGLSFQSCRLKRANLDALAALPALTCLSMGDCDVDGPTLAQLRRLPALETLSISGYHSHLVDADVAALSECQALQELNLVGCQVTSRCLDRLTNLPNLTKLILPGGTDVRSLVALARFPKLAGPLRGRIDEGAHYCEFEYSPDAAWLSVKYGQMSARDAAEYCACPRISKLSLTQVEVSNEAWPVLAGLTNVRQIEVQDVACNDESLMHLAKLTRLEELVIYRFRRVLFLSTQPATHPLVVPCGITPKGFAVFAERYPHLKLTIDEECFRLQPRGNSSVMESQVVPM